MTNLDDFDRSLGAFLRDGPSLAPEAPVIAALAHARTTPRRWDPFAALRPDVMGRRWVIGGLRPALVLAVVGLLATAVGIAVVGSRPQESLPPAPSRSPDASVPPTQGAFAADVQMIVTAGGPLVIRVTDTTGDLRTATSGAPQEGASVEGVSIVGDAGDPAVISVTWVGTPCERTGTLEADETTHRITIVPDVCEGDTFPLDRVLRLTFAGPIDAELWTGRITAPEPSGPVDGSPTIPGAPSTHATLDDTGERIATIDVFDQSGDLTGVSVFPADRAAAVEFLDVTNVAETTLLVRWPGAPCDTVHRLTIAADHGISIDRPGCHGEESVVTRALRLDFDQPVDADTLDRGLTDARPSADFPAWIVDGVDTAGGPWSMAIYDESGSVENPAARFPADATDPGAAGFRLDQAGQSIVQLTWRAAACETAPRLRLDPFGTDWILEGTGCASAEAELLRVLDVKLTRPLSVDAITVTTRTAPP